MGKKYRVKRSCLMCYGSSNKAWITLNKGQIWEHLYGHGIHHPWHTIKRNSVALDVLDADLERYFEEVSK